MRNIVICIVLPFLMVSCDDEFYFFRISNNTDEEICVYDKFYNSEVEWDTLSPNKTKWYSPYTCRPHEGNNVVVRSTSEHYFYFGDNDNNTLDLYIISRDTLKKYGYDVVRKENKIMARYRFSRELGLYLGEDKNAPNVVCYPPDEKMREIGIDVFIYPN